LPPRTATPSAPTEENGAPSEIEFQVMPASVVFQTPPSAAQK